MQRVLHDRHRVQLDQTCAGMSEGFHVTGELMTEMSLPKRNMTAPANSAVADVGAAEVLYAGAVAVDRSGRRKVDVVGRWSQVSFYQSEEVLPHGSFERAGPRHRGGLPVLVRVLVHVESVNVRKREVFPVDHPGRQFVLRHRAYRKYCHERPTLVTRRPKSADDVVCKSPVKGVHVLDDLDVKVSIGVLGDFRSGNRPRQLTCLAVAKGDELGEPVVEGRCRSTHEPLLREASGAC